jgi:hypothetical protein
VQGKQHVPCVLQGKSAEHDGCTCCAVLWGLAQCTCSCCAGMPARHIALLFLLLSAVLLLLLLLMMMFCPAAATCMRWCHSSVCTAYSWRGSLRLRTRGSQGKLLPLKDHEPALAPTILCTCKSVLLTRCKLYALKAAVCSAVFAFQLWWCHHQLLSPALVDYSRRLGAAAAAANPVAAATRGPSPTAAPAGSTWAGASLLWRLTCHPGCFGA